MAEWLKATDCKFVDIRLRRFESYFFQKVNKIMTLRPTLYPVHEDVHSRWVKHPLSKEKEEVPHHHNLYKRGGLVSMSIKIPPVD